MTSLPFAPLAPLAPLAPRMAPLAPRMSAYLGAALCALFLSAAAPASAQAIALCQNGARFSIADVQGMINGGENNFNAMNGCPTRRDTTRTDRESLSNVTWCSEAVSFYNSATNMAMDILQEATKNRCYSCDPALLEQASDLLLQRSLYLRAMGYSNTADQLDQSLRTRAGWGYCADAAGQGSGPGATTGTPPVLDPALNPAFGQGQPPAQPSAGKCTSVDAYSDARLNSGFGWVLENLSLPQCVTTCADEPTCTGYDYNTAAATCVIRSEPQTATGLERYAGWTHYECRN